VRRQPGNQDDSDADKPQDHSHRPPIIRTEDDVIHVPAKPCEYDQRHVDNDEQNPADEKDKMNGPGGLTAAEDSGIARESIHKGNAR